MKTLVSWLILIGAVWLLSWMAARAHWMIVPSTVTCVLLLLVAIGTTKREEL